MHHLVFVDQLSPFVFGLHAQLRGRELGIRWYGMAYLLGFLLMYLFYRRAAADGDVQGFVVDDVDNLAIRIVLGVMVGGRLGFVIQQPGRLLHDPLFLISIWEGGMAYFGGLTGVLIAVWSFARSRKISFLALTDVLAPVAALSLGIGRIANFINGELYGRPTGGDWGVVFPRGGSVPRHPSQLYESASHFLLFAVLMLLARRWRGKFSPGAISWTYLIGYGLLRAITDYWRDDDVYWGPLSDGQWFSLGIAVAGFVALYIWSRASRPKNPPRQT